MSTLNEASQPDASARPTVVGIDWGTTNRRAYVLDGGGRLLRKHSDEFGILAVAGGFEASLATLLGTLEIERADVIMSGMVGSRNGWRQVPYLTVDTPISRLPEALVDIDTGLHGVRCRIVPGYRYDDPHGTPDVMRGEETQVLGALALSASEGWFLLPGTHSKWTRVENGAITEFSTFMTGELFALLTQHGTLAALMDERPSVPAAFEAGVRAAGHGSLTHAAFGCRALVVTDSMPAAHASSYLSGLLIGAELDDIRRREGERGSLRVQMICSNTLVERYGAALGLFGIAASALEPDEVFVAAVRRLAGIEP